MTNLYVLLCHIEVKEFCFNKVITIPGGGALVSEVGYHPHKRTFKTHPKHIFFRYENRP